jgi:N-acetylglucosamine kinase-like BadF-type ATPase
MTTFEASQVVLAIDGGNIKTDVALVSGDGRLLSLIRGTTVSPHALGFDRAVRHLSELVSEACAAAGLGHSGREPLADVARVLLAGADLPEEVDRLQEALGAMGWASHLVVENDTLALLRTGTDRGWGVAVVCGGGINAVGISPDGRDARWPSLGAITGDWGGGHDVGIAALGGACRSADGRGPITTLEQAVPAHFGMRTPLEVVRAFHFKEISLEEIAQLSPVVYEQSAVDPVARDILMRVSVEVAAFARAGLERVDLIDAGADVVIGGGLMRAAPDWMLARIRELVAAVSPSAKVVLAHEGPIVGATILGLDEIGAGPGAVARAREELQRAISELAAEPVY